jgi:hypothetical protein
MTAPITQQEKHEAALREAKMRRRVYPRWVEGNRMTQAKADREIAIMDAIAADYAPEPERTLL